jgi:hypothetical protein
MRGSSFANGDRRSSGSFDPIDGGAVTAGKARSPRVVQGSDALWSSVSGDGFEHVHLLTSDSGMVADGVIVRREQGGTYRTRYIIECSADWRPARLTLEKLDASRRTLTLLCSDHGAWTDAVIGPLPQVEGCVTLDISASPFTNTLAVRILNLQPEASETLRVLYVDPDTLSVRSMSQRYTRIRTDGVRTTYRYESLDGTGFTAELPLDDDGLVIEYPGFFKRVW